MALVNLFLLGLYLVLAVGLRSFVQKRRTGSSGLHGLRPGAGPLETGAALLLALSVALAATAPVLHLAGLLAPLPPLDVPALREIGLVVATAGIATTLAAQLAMGDSWRVGIDQGKRTALVTQGPFRLVRNPIFSAMLAAFLGLALLVPNIVALTAWLCLFLALELHVRAVEEPHLQALHGDAYRRYAARVGRFVPGLGRL